MTGGPGGAADNWLPPPENPLAHTFTSLLYHLVFSTKNRAEQIDGGIAPDLRAYLGGIVRDIGGTPLRINGAADHVRLLVALPQTIAVADALRLIESNSSKWVHETWPQRQAFQWQSGYGAFTVSESRREAVTRYIATQEEHHRRATFREEFLALLKRHRIEYDPRYIWD